MSAAEKTNCAAIFPGQGSQSFAMLAGYAGHSRVLETVREASEIVGVDLEKMINGEDNALHQTANTQPAMLAMGVGVFRAAQSQLQTVTAMAGHSLGEYSALVCAGSLGFARAVKLVYRRGMAMQKAPPGAMAAVVGMQSETVTTLCAKLRESGGEIWAANYNSPVQTVVAGAQESVARAEDAFKKEGARRFVKLEVGAASHCPLMQSAAKEIQEELNALTITVPSATVPHNATAEPAKTPEEIKTFLRRQLTEPVRWTETVRNLAATGVARFYECGPGGILSGLGKRISADAEHIALSSSRELESLR